MKIRTILRYVTLLGIFVIPFIPLYVVGGLFFPFITGKNFAFRFIVEIIAGAWIILAVIDPAYRVRRSGLLVGLLAFIGIIAMADVTGVYPYKSFWSNYERMEGFVTLLHLLGYFIVASVMLSTEKMWSWFLNVSIAVSIIMSGYGFLQLAGKIVINQGGVRLDATLGNATYLAAYMLFHIFITAFIVASEKMFLFLPSTAGRKNILKKSLIGLAVILIQATILYHTATRGAMLGLVGGVFLAATLVAIFERHRRTFRKAGFAVAALMVILVGGFLMARQSEFVQKSPVLQRFASISVSEATTESRFMLWSMALKGLKERPLLGWGQENFNYVFNKYYDPKMYAQEQWFDRTHNIIFDWLIAGGILGLGSYLFFYAALIWYIWRKTRSEYDFSASEKSILTGLLFGYLIHNMFVFDNITSYILFFSIAAYVYARTTLWPHAVLHEYRENRVVAPVVIVAMLAFMYVVNARPLEANINLIAAIGQQSSFSKNLEHFNKALSYGSYGDPEIREQIMAVANMVVGNAQASADLKQQILNLAESEGQNQIDRTPRDARYYVLLGSLLDSAGKHDDALVYLNKATDLSPSKQSILFEIGSALVGKKEYEQAEEVFKKAYDLEPKYETAAVNYATVAIYNKKLTLADELLSRFTADELANNDQILSAYYSAGLYERLLNAWKLRVATDPTNADSHVSLAAAYLLTNNRTKAIAEIQEAIKLNPEFKDQGESFIKDIRAGKTP